MEKLVKPNKYIDWIIENNLLVVFTLLVFCGLLVGFYQLIAMLLEQSESTNSDKFDLYYLAFVPSFMAIYIMLHNYFKQKIKIRELQDQILIIHSSRLRNTDPNIFLENRDISLTVLLLQLGKLGITNDINTKRVMESDKISYPSLVAKDLFDDKNYKHYSILKKAEDAFNEHIPQYISEKYPKKEYYLKLYFIYYICFDVLGEERIDISYHGTEIEKSILEFYKMLVDYCYHDGYSRHLRKAFKSVKHEYNEQEFINFVKNYYFE